MKRKFLLFSCFKKKDILLWCSSVVVIFVSFCIFDKENYLTLAASLIGVTSLIFNAKGNPFGQFLMIIFSVLYGIISFSFSYYGEMITYLGMTAPMAVVSLISWLRNPYQGYGCIDYDNIYAEANPEVTRASIENLAKNMDVF